MTPLAERLIVAATYAITIISIFYGILAQQLGSHTGWLLIVVGSILALVFLRVARWVVKCRTMLRLQKS